MTRSRAISLLLMLVAMAATTGVVDAQLIKQRDQMPELQGVGMDPHRGDPFPQDLVFTDADGRSVSASSFFDGERPVMLVMAYYDCPLLCTLVLNNVQMMLNKLKWTAGEEFRIVTISFDHTNTTEMARSQQELYLLGYDREELAEDAWVFLTSDATNAQALARAIGFHYRFIPETKEFSHPAALTFLTPTGTIHNYIENLEYRPRDVKLALLEASEGKQGSIFDRVEHLCFVYDPDSGGYVLAMGVMKIGALVTMLALGGFICRVVWTSAHRRAPAAEKAHEATGEATESHHA